jgi:two-component system chemotaxis sensor kinase CheA
MSTRDQEALSLFLADAAEAIRNIEESLLILESGPGQREELNLLYRGMHTLKGNAAFLELHAVEALAHACEDLVSLPRDHGVPFDPAMIGLLLEALDRLRWAVHVLSVEHRTPPLGAVTALVERITTAFVDRGGVKHEQLSPEQGSYIFGDDGEEVVLTEAVQVSPEVAALSAEEAEAAATYASTTAAVGEARRAERAERAVERREFLRVDAQKVGALMDLAGELGLACSAVTRHPDVVGRDLEGFAAAAHRLELLVRELQNDLSSLRLVPVAPVFQRLRRVVEDAARRTHKEVDLVVRGEDTEVDKVMIDALQDPLVHVLRNAVDHGLEEPAARVDAGKPPRGRVVLSASHQGGEITIEVRDDGRGLQRDRILARAIERGLCSADAQPTDDELAGFVFLPGFSTKDTADTLSGRGVGMDVLKTTVESLRGRVTLKSTPGQGSRVTLKLPLTLAFVEAMVVRERGRLFALPIEKVFEVSKVEQSRVVTNSADDQVLLRVRETCVPVLWLDQYWGEAGRERSLSGKVVVVVQTARGAVALPVDELLGNQQVMLKPLHGPLSHIRAAAGCGMLRTGDVAIALDCDRLHA